MSREFIHRNDAGHHLAEKSIPVEYHEPPKIIEPGNFRVVTPGQTFPHDVGCLCEACVSRRRDQARNDPEMRRIVEQKAATLPPAQAQALRDAIFGKRQAWWHFW